MKLFGKKLAGDPQIALWFAVAFAAIVLLTFNCEGSEEVKPKTESHENII